MTGTVIERKRPNRFLTGIRLKTDHMEKLNAIAGRSGCTRSKVIDRAIEVYLLVHEMEAGK